MHPEEKICRLNSVLCYRLDIYFHDYKLAIEVDQLDHNDRNVNHEIQRQKEIEKLEWEFKSNHSIKSKGLKELLNIYCREYKTCKPIV